MNKISEYCRCGKCTVDELYVNRSNLSGWMFPSFPYCMSFSKKLKTTILFVFAWVLPVLTVALIIMDYPLDFIVTTVFLTFMFECMIFCALMIVQGMLDLDID